MSEREWYRRWKKYKKDFKPTKRKLSQGMADFSKSENPWAGPVISVLISLYKSDEYLDSFLSALQNQSIKQNTEFIFILVQPSKNTIAKVNAFAGSVQYVQIQYYDCRIGIYEAWNHGIRAATTEFLTNWNADDVRAPDSLEIQYLYLSAHLEVDVVYQDLYYSLEPNVPWEVLEAIGMQSNLPNVTAQYLIETKMNPPHNAPAWRRSLHEEFGFFDESYLSAGDYEFWEDFL
jgi:glycosyltransferase involved in cell wall biosynthesis